MKKQRIFCLFIIPYLLLTVIIVGVFGLIYRSYKNVLEERSKQYNILKLEKNISVVDIDLKNISINMVGLADSDYIKEINQASPSISITQLMDMQEKLKSHYFDTEMICAEYISLIGKDFIVARKNSSLSKNEFFNSVVNLKDITEEEILKNIQSQNRNNYVFTEQKATVSGMDFDVIPIISPIHNNESLSGYICVLVNSKMLKKIAFSGFEEVHTFILDYDENVIASDVEEHIEYKFNDMSFNDDQVTFSVKSDFNRWGYIVSIDQKDVYGFIKELKTTAIASVIFAIVLAFLVGWRFICVNALPLARIYGIVETNEEQNVYENIYEYIFRLKKDQSEFYKYIEKNSDFINGGVIRKLLDGSFKSNDELEEQSAYMNYDFNNKSFWVTVIKLNTEGIKRDTLLKKQHMANTFIYSILEENIKYFGDIVYFVSTVGHDAVSILFCTPSSNGRDIKYMCISLEKFLKREFDNKFGGCAGIKTGDIRDNPLQINDCYISAINKIDESIDKIPKYDIVSLNYWYPSDLEDKIINLVMAGETDKLADIVNQIIDHNFREKEISDADKKILYYEIQVTLIKLLKEKTVEFMPNQLPYFDENDIETTVSKILSFMQEICLKKSKSNKKINKEIYREIKNYILQNYWDHNLALATVGDKYGLSEAYISSLFKKNQDSFLSYLERTRLGYACELLKDDDVLIADIAEMVGYGSDQSFRRAFKRVFGISPKAYRDAYKGNN